MNNHVFAWEYEPPVYLIFLFLLAHVFTLVLKSDLQADTYCMLSAPSLDTLTARQIKSFATIIRMTQALLQAALRAT